MIILSPKLENYQFSQPRYIFLVYGNTIHVRILYVFHEFNVVATIILEMAFIISPLTAMLTKRTFI